MIRRNVFVVALLICFFNAYSQMDTINATYFANLKVILSKDPNIKQIKFVQKKIADDKGFRQIMYVKFKNDSKNRYWHVGKEFIYNSSNNSLGAVRNADLIKGILIDTSYYYDENNHIIALEVFDSKSEFTIPVKQLEGFWSWIFSKYFENSPNIYSTTQYSCNRDTLIEKRYKFFEMDGFLIDGNVIYYNKQHEVLKTIKYDRGVEMKTKTYSNHDSIFIKGMNAQLMSGRKFNIDDKRFIELSKDTICNADTVLVSGGMQYPKNKILPDMSSAFLATYCDINSKFGYKFEFGILQNIYSKSVANWIGNHLSADMGINLIYNNINLGFRYKPSTINPKTELRFNNVVLPKDADLDPIKSDYFVSYDFKLNDIYSIEPSVGYTISTFKVIDEKEGQHFNFNSVNGLTLGVAFNKNIRFDTFSYGILFGRINYGFVDYSQVYTNLGKNYLEACIGIAFKFNRKKTIYNLVK